MDYKPLEPRITSELGLGNQSLSFKSDQPISFYASTSFIYTLFFVAIVTAGFYRYVLAAGWRMQGSSTSISKSNETFKTVTLGLLGVFSLFLILYTFNKDLLVGDVGFESLKIGGATASGEKSRGLSPTSKTISQTQSSGTSKTCASTNEVIASLTSPSGICGNASCTSLSGCNYQQYFSIINQESARQGLTSQQTKMVIALMCKESSANVKAENKNPNGTYDCGLMQINSKSPCDSSILNPQTNIAQGVTLLKQKILTSNQIYPNIPPETGPFSSYNCCANGTIPNAPSADCTQASSFPYTVPKWACPINPGEGEYNMCGVKAYVCELTACLKEL